jgi:hypothetical protein
LGRTREPTAWSYASRDAATLLEPGRRALLRDWFRLSFAHKLFSHRDAKIVEVNLRATPTAPNPKLHLLFYLAKIEKNTFQKYPS